MIRGLLLVLIAAAAGCKGSAPTTGVPDVMMADGFYLELSVRNEENYAVFYKVNGAQRLGFGGGRDAMNRQLSWIGALTNEEFERLFELLERNGWFAGTVESTGEPRKNVARATLVWKGGRKRFKRTGRSAQIEPVEKLLADAARRRLDRDLEALPAAGPR